MARSLHSDEVPEATDTVYEYELEVISQQTKGYPYAKLPTLQLAPGEAPQRVPSDGDCFYACVAALQRYYDTDPWPGMDFDSDDATRYQPAVRNLRRRMADHLVAHAGIFLDRDDQENAWKAHIVSRLASKLSTEEVKSLSGTNLLLKYVAEFTTQMGVYSDDLDFDIASNLFNVIIHKYVMPREMDYKGKRMLNNDIPWTAAELTSTFQPSVPNNPSPSQWTIVFDQPGSDGLGHFWWINGPKQVKVPGKKKKMNPIKDIDLGAKETTGGKRKTTPAIVKGDSKDDNPTGVTYSSIHRQPIQPSTQPVNIQELRRLANEYRSNASSWPTAAAPAAASSGTQ